ncbi:hypothetical protein NRS6141_02610 [Bacillus subtilis]|nr:hypothetical protein C7M27_03871 [Bacillus subtilis]CAF1831313.1 hypothetical protein NRS6141_02610 [Bacillus subtilis]CAF1905757.1 hypothetical protein NRS6205_02627 [Bacillus subtilis]CAF1916508.1 hypothetical protein NRS6204_04109 [Bacillus subtilis]
MTDINLDFIAPIDTSFIDKPFSLDETLKDTPASLSLLTLLMIRLTSMHLSELYLNYYPY